MSIRVTAIQIENAGLFSAMSMSLDGESRIIAGGPDEGKTTLLEFLAYALTGGRKTPKVLEMVRAGEKKGKAAISLKDWKSGDEYTLTLAGHVDKKGENVVEVRCVNNASAIPMSREDIRALLSRIGPDILELQKLPPTGNNGQNQVNRLLQMFGLENEYNKIKADREEIYNKRRDANRDLKRLEGALSEHPPVPANTPDELQETAALMAELKAASDQNARHKTAADEIGRALVRLREINEELIRLTYEKEAIGNNLKRLESARQENPLIPLGEIEHRAANVDAVNDLVRRKKARAALQNQIKTATAQAAAIDDQIAAKDDALAKLIQKVDLGVNGLSFDENVGLILNGRPLITEGTSTQMRTYATLALNSIKGEPDKITTFILDGAESVGEDGVAEIIKAANEADAQVLLTFNTKQRILKDRDYVVYIKSGEFIAPELFEEE
jgi:hypothetical protein